MLNKGTTKFMVEDSHGSIYTHTKPSTFMYVLVDFKWVGGLPLNSYAPITVELDWYDSWKNWHESEQDEVLTIEHDDGVELLQRKFITNVYTETSSDVTWSSISGFDDAKPS